MYSPMNFNFESQIFVTFIIVEKNVISLELQINMAPIYSAESRHPQSNILKYTWSEFL